MILNDLDIFDLLVIHSTCTISQLFIDSGIRPNTAEMAPHLLHVCSYTITKKKLQVHTEVFSLLFSILRLNWIYLYFVYFHIGVFCCSRATCLTLYFLETFIVNSNCSFFGKTIRLTYMYITLLP